MCSPDYLILDRIFIMQSAKSVHEENNLAERFGLSSIVARRSAKSSRFRAHCGIRSAIPAVAITTMIRKGENGPGLAARHWRARVQRCVALNTLDLPDAAVAFHMSRVFHWSLQCPSRHRIHRTRSARDRALRPCYYGVHTLRALENFGFVRAAACLMQAAPRQIGIIDSACR